MYERGVSKQRERSKPKDPGLDFKPKINISAKRIKRHNSISDILYTDALRRHKWQKRKVHSSLDFHGHIGKFPNKSPTNSWSRSRSRARKITQLSKINQGTFEKLNVYRFE